MLQRYAEREAEPSTSRPQADLITKFDELAKQNLIHPNVINTIITPAPRGMGHHTMTQVQSETINEALEGVDMYVSPT